MKIFIKILYLFHILKIVPRKMTPSDLNKQLYTQQEVCFRKDLEWYKITYTNNFKILLQLVVLILI